MLRLSERDGYIFMPRDYGKVSPAYWTGETGIQLRNAGSDAQLVGLYLLTCPAATAIGIFHMPVPLLAHHVGFSHDKAAKVLFCVCKTGFCQFDAALETIFVPRMAHFQLGPTMKQSDNRHKFVLAELARWHKSPFFEEFHRLYGAAYHLPPRAGESPLEEPPVRDLPPREESPKPRGKKAGVASKSKTFEPPTLAEVAGYCAERKNKVDSQRFIDHYTANGWQMGKSRMKDWRAAVRTWEKNLFEAGNSHGKSNAPGPGQLFDAAKPVQW